MKRFIFLFALVILSLVSQGQQFLKFTSDSAKVVPDIYKDDHTFEKVDMSIVWIISADSTTYTVIFENKKDSLISKWEIKNEAPWTVKLEKINVKGYYATGKDGEKRHISFGFDNVTNEVMGIGLADDFQMIIFYVKPLKKKDEEILKKSS